jgi:hypothetical protein
VSIGWKWGKNAKASYCQELVWMVKPEEKTRNFLEMPLESQYPMAASLVAS